MEFCRRWGIADRVRDWAFPRDFPFDDVFVTSLAGYELGRIRDAVARGDAADRAEPGAASRTARNVFDPILARARAQLPLRDAALPHAR